MPVVPFSPAPRPTTPAELGPQPSMTDLAIAAHMIHSENEKMQPHDIEEGPEYNKWDEALQQYGAIRLPKERDNPQEWMNQHDKMLRSNGIDREDRPDGSVILRKQVPSS